MRRAIAAIASTAFLVACESIVGVDYGAYTDKCTPLDDKCPMNAPCVYNLTKSAFVCQASSGQRYQDESCDDESECAPGYACSRFQNNNFGHCTRYCLGPSSCPSNRCLQFEIARKLPGGQAIGACGPLDPPCNPLGSTSSCTPGRCTLYDSDYTACDQLENMTIAVNQPCEYLQQCVAGTTCIGSPALCRELCDLDSPSCSSGTCEPYQPARTLNGRRIGLCR